MKKLITRDQETNLELKCVINSADLPNNTQDIKLVGDHYIDLQNLNLNIVKYEIYNVGSEAIIKNSNINKLILNISRKNAIMILNSNIQDIYVQSEIYILVFINTNIPNLHGKVDLIDKIIIRE